MILVIFVISGFVLVLSQWWSGLDTPDSEFYLSLSVFTNAVTDRAPDDSYFWTRLGYIAPAHALTSALGVWAGFAAWKAFQLLLIVGSAFAVIRRHTDLVRTTWLTAAIATSSVIVSYLGNAYITAPVMAGTAVLIALGTSRHLAAAPFAGIVLGWLAMSYPGGALLGGSIWLALTIHTWVTKGIALRRRIQALILASLTTLGTLGIFLLAGAALFPGLNWLATYIEASKFDYGV